MSDHAITLGVDLAAQATRTALCAVHWEDGRGKIFMLDDGRTDADLAKYMHGLNARIAIDAPFGWPVAFLEEIRQFTETGTVPWPDDLDEHRRRLRLRATDRHIQASLGLTPLSVSTDRIGVVALRCARLLAYHWENSHEPPDRSGDGRVLEVYPAAALRQWRLRSPFARSYKGASPSALENRRCILEAIARYSGGWFDLAPEWQEQCEQSDHKLDALVCALVARAADIGHVLPVNNPAHAATEGWIRVPFEEPLSRLGAGLATVSDWMEPEQDYLPRKLVELPAAE